MARLPQKKEIESNGNYLSLSIIGHQLSLGYIAQQKYIAGHQTHPAILCVPDYNRNLTVASLFISLIQAKYNLVITAKTNPKVVFCEIFSQPQALKQLAEILSN
jgi:hypothetical protein